MNFIKVGSSRFVSDCPKRSVRQVRRIGQHFLELYLDANCSRINAVKDHYSESCTLAVRFFKFFYALTANFT